MLYLPAGTYRITATLVMKERLGVSILGEDPATTKIVWDGAQDGAMTWFNGVAYSRWGRITWDGAGKAKVAVDHGWEGKQPNAGTHNEHADEVFQDVAFGIKGGSRGFMDAETAVLRCRFLRCTSAGLSIENFNALDWYAWYCLFEDCQVGVTNKYGAGHYHVYECVFRRSKVADLTMGNLGYFSIRGNYSTGSKCFMTADQYSGGALCTLQGNVIVNTTDAAAVQYHNLGPLLFIDNTIVSRPTAAGPALAMTNDIPWGADLVAVGNNFTVEKPMVCKGRFRELDTKVTPTLPTPPEPALPGTAPNLHRPLVELAKGCSGADIQAAINQAGKWRGKHPVIHLPASEYKIDQTLVIPAGLDVQLVGDGYIYTTRLNWAGPAGGTVVRMEGPARATLRDLHVASGGHAEGVVIAGCDKAGGRVFGEQISTEGNLGVGLLADGLDRCNVEFHDYYHSGATDCSVRVSGGPRRAAGQATGGRVALLGGGSSNNAWTYDVQKGGYLISRDMWYETNKQIGFVKLSDSGTFTFHAGIIALPADPAVPAVQLNNFRGQATFLSTELASVDGNPVIMKVSGEGKETRMLVLGACSRRSDEYLFNDSPNAQVALTSCRHSDAKGTEAIDNVGPQEDQFLRDMLAQARKEQPTAINDLPGGTPDARLYRVFVSDCTVGVHLLP